jgi:hypothetical protein
MKQINELAKYHIIKARQHAELERRRVAEYHEFTDDWRDGKDWGPLGGKDAYLDQFAVLKLCEGLRDSPDLWCIETIDEIEARANYHIEAWEQTRRIKSSKNISQERSEYCLTENQINQDLF